MNARVATQLAGPGGAKLLELERETGKLFTVEPVERMPLTEVDVIREGSRADVDGDSLPVADGDELRVKISEPHMYNITDGVARMNGGYGVVIGGAIGYIGQEHRIRIDRATPHRRVRDAARREDDGDPARAGAGVLLRAARRWSARSASGSSSRSAPGRAGRRRTPATKAEGRLEGDEADDR